MSDLINREALAREILFGKDKPEMNDGQDIANWQHKCIADAPAVDAVEVVHGRWNRYTVGIPGEIGAECSACNQYCDEMPAGVYYKYCPNCGAKMDGGTQ